MPLTKAVRLAEPMGRAPSSIRLIRGLSTAGIPMSTNQPFSRRTSVRSWVSRRTLSGAFNLWQHSFRDRAAGAGPQHPHKYNHGHQGFSVAVSRDQIGTANQRYTEESGTKRFSTLDGGDNRQAPHGRRRRHRAAGLQPEHAESAAKS